MAKKLYEESDIQDIAVAIRYKNGESTKYKARDMAAAVRAIPTGGVEFDMSVEPNQVKMIVRIPNWNKKQMTRFSSTVVKGECIVDWGDGTIESFIPDASSVEYVSQCTHEYVNSGLYLISITAKDGNLIIGGTNAFSLLSENKLITGEDKNSQSKLRKAFLSRIIELSVGDDVIVKAAISNIQMLHITMPFKNDLSNYRISSSGISELYIPESITIIPSYFASSSVVEYISFPSTIKEIKNNAFDMCSCTSVFDFTKIRLDEDGNFPIILSATNTFRGISGYIVFADEEIANVAKNATNWAVYAKNIKHRGEVSW